MNNTNIKKIKFKIIIIIFLFIVTVLFKKIVTHELWQSGQIHTLMKQNESLIYQISKSKKEIESLQNDVIKLQSSYVYYSDKGYNYLAIGNSITKHAKTNYWWNEIGMAATTAANDFYHLIVQHLKNNNNDVISYSYNFAEWETQGWDRSQTFKSIKPYLSEKLNLITIQLGENVTDMSTFEADFEELIDYVKTNSPNATIVVIGDFWVRDERDEIKERVSNNYNAKFVSLNKIHDKKYQCGVGTTVFDDMGIPHIVEHNGVASHPNDEGMRQIANGIIESLQ